MACITDLDITYGAALAPSGFHKITLPDGGQAELNRGTGTTPSFLWYHDGAGRGDPIVSIVVSHEETGPEGYEKVPKNMVKGTKNCSYIFFRRSKESDPIGEIRLLYKDAEPDANFEKIEPSITITNNIDDSVHLAVRRVSKDTAPRWSAFSLAVGDWCDAKDSIDKWCVAQVCEADDNTVKVHFKGWSSKWDEVVPRTSNKIAELGTHTSGKDTGWGKRVQGGTSTLTMEDIDSLLERLNTHGRASSSQTQEDQGTTSADNSSVAAYEQMWLGDIPDTVDVILTTTCADIKMIPKINALLQKILLELAYQLKDVNSEFLIGRFQLLERIFMCDENFTWYYTHYGLGGPDDAYLTATDLMLDGPVCKVAKQSSASRMLSGQNAASLGDLSKLLLSNINVFGEAGGFNALISRMDNQHCDNPRYIANLTLVLAVAIVMKDLTTIFHKKYLAVFLPLYTDVIFKRLNVLSIDTDLREILEKKECKNIVDQILNELDATLRVSWKDYPIAEKKEKYRMEFAKRLITCPFLNLRIRGASMLSEIVDAVNLKDVAARRSYGVNLYGAAKNSNDTELSISWITPNWLCAWFVQGDAVDILLGDPQALQSYDLPDSHDEILKRSCDVLLFLISKGSFNEKYLNMLWRAGHATATPSQLSSSTSAGGLNRMMQSSATAKTVYKLLTTIVPKLSVPLVEALAGLVRTLPPNTEMDTVKVELIRVMVETAASGIGVNGFEAEDFGLSVLWSCLVEHSAGAATSANQLAAAEGLASILSKPTTRKILMRYLEKAVVEIRSGSDASFSCILLLQKIISAQPEAAKVTVSKHSVTQESIVAHCEDNFQLLDAIYENLNILANNYSDNQETIETMRKTTSLTSLENASNQRQSKSSIVSSILKFLQFILTHSTLELDINRIKQLYITVSTILNQYEMDIFFEWVISVCPEDLPVTSQAPSSYYSSALMKSAQPVKSQCVTDDAIRFIFTDIFQSDIMLRKSNSSTFLKDTFQGFNMRYLGPKGYGALEKIFRYMNGQKKNIMLSYNVNQFTVNNAELIGLSTLLNAYLTTENVSVAKEACAFIILLHVRLSGTLNKKAVWSEFTNLCMREIHSHCNSREVEDDHSFAMQYTNRLLVLLTKFLVEITSNAAAFSVGPSHGVQSPVKGAASQANASGLKITVFWKRENTSNNTTVTSTYVFKSGGITVGSLRSRLARDLHVTPPLVRLINSTRNILTSAHDMHTLESAGVVSFVDVILLKKPAEEASNFKLVPPAMTLAEDPNSDQMYPRTLISNQRENLQLLFELLSDKTSDEIAQSAWRLLELLPTNADILDEVKSLGGAYDYKTKKSTGRVDWNKLLSVGGRMRQQYKLKVIVSILSTLSDDFVSSDDKTLAFSWGNAFLTQGGVQYCFDLLWNSTSTESNQVVCDRNNKEWLVQLLQLIVNFISIKSSQTNTANDGNTGKNNSSEFTSKFDAKDIITSLCEDTNIVVKFIQMLSVYLSPSDDRLNGTKSISTADDNSLVRSSSTKASKRDRKRSRVARFEQYFSSVSKNTSSALTLDRAGNNDVEDGDDDRISKYDTISTDAQLAEHIFSLILTMVLCKSDLSTKLLSLPELEDILRDHLLLSKDRDIRVVLSSKFLQMCQITVQLTTTIHFTEGMLSQVLNLLPNILSPDELNGNNNGSKVVHYTEYFELLSQMLTIHSQVLRKIDVKSLTDLLTDFLTSRESQETSEEDEDVLVQCVLKFYQSLLSAVPIENQNELKYYCGIQKHLLQHIFLDSLFSFHSNGSNKSTQSSYLPKYKNYKTREAAFGLVKELCVNCVHTFTLLLDYIEPHHSLDILRTGRNTTAKKIMSADNKKAITLRTPSMQLLGGAVVPKSKTGYCGLYNPGCICYMNSTLQQLFMTSAFRKGILEIETDIRNKDDTEIAEDMLYQLQLLFAYLQESDKAYVDPRGFSYSFRDYEGMPTDNMVQQDASEFLANFFQQIEGAIMGTKSETLLKDTFGGVLSNELLAEENRRSERPEPFYMLSVAVGQGNKCLSDALESYIAGDTVDYTWESGGKDNIPLTKVSLPTIKRVSIKTLPNKLIVHLKRFEFDFETMQQIKINDRFEYPMNLNMYPYTVDARQRNENSGNESSSDEPIVNPENYMYELTGVVVHLGTAHSGHYYSYIRSDAGILSLSEETDDQAKQKWFEFNDSFVSEFDPEDLEDETFGGSDTHVLSTSSSAASLSNKVGSPGGVTPQKPVTHAKVQNAFMLVYTRSIQSPMSTVSESRSRARTMSTEVAPQVSASILESIRKDNMMYWRTKCIFNPVYYKFLSDVLMQKKYLRIENSPASSHLVESLLDKSVRIALGTMVQAREIDFVATWANWLKSVLQGYPRRCYIVLNILCGEQTTSKVTEAYTDIMQEQQQTSTPLQCLNRLLLGPEDPDIRHTIMRVIRCCMETLLQQSDHVENQSSTDASEDVSATDSYDACMKFVQMVVALIRDAQISWRHIDVFFDPITVFASFQKKAQQELVSMGVLGSLISFFLGHDTPFPALVGGAEPGNHKSRSMTDGVYFPNMKSLLLAVAALLPDVSKDSKGLSRMTAGVDMSSECITMMQSAVFQYRLLKCIRHPDVKALVFPIARFCLIGSETNTKMAVDMIISSVRKEDGVDVKPAMRYAMVLCEIRDQLSNTRISLLMASLLSELQANVQYIMATEVSITMFLRLGKYYPVARAWIKSNKDKLKWMDTWLNTRRSGGHPQGSQMGKVKRTTGNNSTVATPAQNSTTIANANLVLLRCIIADKGDDVLSGYDSDEDPVSLISRRIRVKWSDNKEYCGTICSYNENTGMHTVQYDDGDVKQYNLAQKVWSFTK